MPGLNPFPFVLSSSCTTLYLPLNPALGREFSCEFSLAFFLIFGAETRDQVEFLAMNLLSRLSSGI
jgi:hypothetical protein